ncbi:MAG TPA: carboxypeptidase-like regulatory domain-containing protein [Bryobacteraceae bacterium]|nr:carboxypeptidase-like regulatory domain-containing protein [Bryobacteraceae bacterium]
MTSRLFAAALLAALAFGQNAAVQQDPQKSKKEKREEAALRTVQGTVYDAKDQAVVGAVVQLKNLRTLQMRSYISKTDGEYHFSGLKMDEEYEVEAKSNGMTSGVKKISIFDNRKTVTQNLKADKPEKPEKK